MRWIGLFSQPNGKKNKLDLLKFSRFLELVYHLKCLSARDKSPFQISEFHLRHKQQVYLCEDHTFEKMKRKSVKGRKRIEINVSYELISTKIIKISKQTKKIYRSSPVVQSTSIEAIFLSP
jgi:hypothetical protein